MNENDTGNNERASRSDGRGVVVGRCCQHGRAGLTEMIPRQTIRGNDAIAARHGPARPGIGLAGQRLRCDRRRVVGASFGNVDPAVLSRTVPAAFVRLAGQERRRGWRSGPGVPATGEPAAKQQAFPTSSKSASSLAPRVWRRFSCYG